MFYPYLGMSSRKENIITAFSNLLLDKEKQLIMQWNELQESLTGETKSSAGDKHETGRASIHLEQENLSKQINVLKSEIEIFKKVNFSNNSHTVSLGSLIITENVSFLFSGVSGKIVIDNKTYFSISSGSPIARLIDNLKIGDEFPFAGRKTKILEII